MAEDKSPGAWIGIAASVVAVLAFFGITNFDQLQKAVDPSSAITEACQKASEAQRGMVDQPKTADKYRTYGLRLGVAADSTDDAELKAYLRSTADIAEEAAKAADPSDLGFSSEMHSEVLSRGANWIRYCNENGGFSWS